MANDESRKKYRETIKYIAYRSIDDRNFGRVKLNKILFYCDFLAYRDLGKSITNDGYIKQTHGPVPTHAKKMAKALIDDGEIKEIKTPTGNYIQKRLITLTDCDLKSFKPEEIALIDSVIEVLWDETAKAVSELSHQFIGWRMMDIGENIPYKTVLIREAEVTDDDLAIGAKLIEELDEWPTVLP